MTRSDGGGDEVRGMKGRAAGKRDKGDEGYVMGGKGRRGEENGRR